jgi:magnesium chelatase family protein
MSGPPRGGKTLLARALPSILPHMTLDEALETTKNYSVTGMLPTDRPFVMQRPFRVPHSTVRHAALFGGREVAAARGRCALADGRLNVRTGG